MIKGSGAQKQRLFANSWMFIFFEAFCWNISLSTNLLFLKSAVLWNKRNSWCVPQHQNLKWIINLSRGKLLDFLQPAIHYNYEYKLLTLVYYLGYEHKVACMTHLHDSNSILGTFLSKESTDVSKAPMRITLLKKIICSCFIRDLELKRNDWLPVPSLLLKDPN